MAHQHQHQHNARHGGHRLETVIDMAAHQQQPEKAGGGGRFGFTGGLEFTSLTYTVVKKQRGAGGEWEKKDVDLLHEITGYAPKGCVTAVMGPSGAGKSTFLDALAGRIASLDGRVALDGVEMSPSLIKRSSAYVMQDDRLFPMLTVYETLMFAADFRLGSTVSASDKKLRVENLIEQLGLTSSRNTFIGDEGTRGVSGGERRRVSIGVDIIHGPALLFLDEPTSGLDSTSAHSVIEKVHDIACAGSTVVLTIHQPSSRILLLLDHLIILARGQLMYSGGPKEVTAHLGRMGRKVPKGENSIEHLLDVIQEYEQSEHGVKALAEFCLTGLKPPKLIAAYGAEGLSTVSSIPQTPILGPDGDDFDRSLRSQHSKSPWSGVQLTPSRRPKHKDQHGRSHEPPSAPHNHRYTPEIVMGTPTPLSSAYTVDEDDYLTPTHHAAPNATGAPGVGINALGHRGKFANSYVGEVWVLIRRNFTNIWRTPELFLSRLMVLTVMGFLMATMFIKPKDDTQGITNRLSFFIFTVCVFFFSSNDAVPAFIQERFIFIRETSHNAYRASAYVVAGLITYLPFLLLQSAPYAGIVWFALKLHGQFLYFLVMLYASLLSTNSFVVFISSVVPNFILGYAAVIAFTALFFLFCGYFLNSHSIPVAWKWMNTISTMKYPYEGLLMNEFDGDRVFATGPPDTLTGDDILRLLGISTVEDRKWWMVLYLLGWAVFYRVLFYLVLRFASKNKRK
ncbi:ABC transporter G family member 1 [Dichanthelium oligosanthes]|uniref:ABC transporter G family member STR2 n=1 Tax=Dichanthelium oligosanthes TaxID=888268 RepID=A0A1E5UY51_9POAL|nr:ABC transporter G family member 1 [Dichanthelium oligosanthes]